MTWEIHSASKCIEDYSIWEDANKQLGGTPLHDPRFISALLKNFGTGKEVVARKTSHNQLIAICILRKKAAGLWETFQPSQAPIGIWLHRKGTSIESLTRSLARDLPGYMIGLGITQLDPQITERPCNTSHIQTIDYIKTARITIDTDFEDYWNQRGKNLRHNMKRQHKRLIKDGITPQLHTITKALEIYQAIKDYGRIESAGWKAGLGTAISHDNAQGKFYEEILTTFAESGQAHIYQYLYNDRLVASDLCISDQDNLIILKTTYDETHQRTSPALLMRKEYFEHVFDHGKFKAIEFYGKVMEWHTKWSNEFRTLYHLNYYRYSVLTMLSRIKHNKNKNL